MGGRAEGHCVPGPLGSHGPGAGLLVPEGWTPGLCGRHWDVIRSAALLGLEAPRALERGPPIDGQIAVQFQPSSAERDHLLADRVHQPYPVADLDDPDAM